MSFNGGALTGGTIDNYKINVCRPNINPAGEKCDHVGNRIEFQVVTDDVAHPTHITTLAMNVPLFLDNGTTLNGAVTELGFDAVAGATHRGRAGTFYLYDVQLTAQLRVALQDVSASASLGFLAVKATAAGTVGAGDWLVSLDATIALKNPLSNTRRVRRRSTSASSAPPSGTGTSSGSRPTRAARLTRRTPASSRAR